jgi:hypothetical protein
MRACTANSTSVTVANATFTHPKVNRIFLPPSSSEASPAPPKIANGGGRRITQIAYF